MHYWRNGPLPSDHAELAAIARFDSRSWKTVAGPVLRFFTVDGDGLLHQKRMDHERNRWAQISDKRRAAGKAGADAKWQPNGGEPPDKPHGKRMANATELPSEKMANATPENGKCQNFAIAPVPLPVPRVPLVEGNKVSNVIPLTGDSESRGKENAPDAVGSEAVAAQVRRVARACAMTVHYPASHTRSEQLEALEATQPLDALEGEVIPPAYPMRPCEPARSVDEQLAWLAANP
jgi:uncharacterized protein YdaU (DUF1376 family)